MFLPSRKKKDENLEKHLELEDNLLSLFENEELDVEELMNNIKEFQILRKDKRELKFPVLLKEKKLEEDLVKKYEELKKEIISVYNFLDTSSNSSTASSSNSSIASSNSSTASLNLHKVKDFLIEFSKLIKDEIQFPDVDINGIVLTDNEEKIPLLFKDGKKTILTNRNFDLSQFTYEELVEILRFLDIIIKDDSYDYLRSEISKEIASISSFTPVKS